MTSEVKIHKDTRKHHGPDGWSDSEELPPIVPPAGEDEGCAACLLDRLNPEQRAAAEHFDGPAIVKSAAGTGKTTTVVHRVANLVINHDVEPHRICAVTFTKGAALEMEKRVKALTGDVAGLSVGTIHSLALSILRQEVRGAPRVDDGTHFRATCKEVMGYKGMNFKDGDLGEVLKLATFAWAELIHPCDEHAWPDLVELAKSLPDPERYATVVKRATAELIAANRMTFDMMVPYALEVLEKDETAFQKWSGRFRFLIQDEAQDQNYAQARFLTALAEEHGNYMQVGDPAQAIYAFRGARPELMTQWADDMDAELYVIDRNYRSGVEIIEAANGVVEAIEHGTPLVSTVERRGRVSVSRPYDADGAAEEILETVQQTHPEARGGIVVLARTAAQLRAVEDLCYKRSIPVVNHSGGSFYHRKEVATVIDYIRVALGATDQKLVRRTLTRPFRFIGRPAMQWMEKLGGGDMVRGAEIALKDWDAALGSGHFRTKKQLVEVKDWLQTIWDIGALEQTLLDAMRAGETVEADAASIVKIIRQRCNILDWLAQEDGAETVDTAREANLTELSRLATGFRTGTGLVHYIDQIDRRRAKQARNKLAGEAFHMMTIHRSKGLEFDTVFLLNVVEGSIPHKRAVTPDEERRLFYVATTRAKEELVYFAPETHGRDSKGEPRFMCPSRFIELAEAGMLAATRTGAK